MLEALFCCCLRSLFSTSWYLVVFSTKQRKFNHNFVVIILRLASGPEIILDRSIFHTNPKSRLFKATATKLTFFWGNILNFQLAASIFHLAYKINQVVYNFLNSFLGPLSS